MKWTSGYINEIDYTHGYYAELNPLNLSMSIVDKGCKFIAPKSCCELGIGQGLSVSIHSVASSARWCGNDFNPTQIQNPKMYLNGISDGAVITDESFAEFCKREDLGSFDFIALHGIFSWISDENRNVILKFIRDRLNVGGILYISYNCSSGQYQISPMREIISQYIKTEIPFGLKMTDKISRVKSFLKNTLDSDSILVKNNPILKAKFEKILKHNANYIAHEYLNSDWESFNFAQVSELLSEAKLTYVSSAFPADEVNALNYNKAQQSMLSDISSKETLITVQDFFTGQQFRRDIWMKGPQILSPAEQKKAKLNTNVILSQFSDIDFKITGGLRPVELDENIYGPIIAHLKKNNVNSVAEIYSSVSNYKINFNQVWQALMLLKSKGALAPANPIPEPECISASKKLNSNIIKLSHSREQANFLASPVTGGGTFVSRVEQLYLTKTLHDCIEPEELANYALQLFKKNGESFIKTDNVLDEDELKHELLQGAEKFISQKLIMLESLQVGADMEFLSEID